MNKDDQPDMTGKTAWSFIGGTKQTDKPFEETICRDVERETNIKLKAVELLSSDFYFDRKRYFFHAKLTDENVNNIKRADGQTLAFFTLKELGKLQLATTTRLFLLKHRELFEKVASE